MTAPTAPARTFDEIVADASTEALRNFVRVARRSLSRRYSRSVAGALRVVRRELLRR